MAGILFFQKSGAKEAKEADKRGAERRAETACGERQYDGRQHSGAIWETDGAIEKSGATGETDSAARDDMRQTDSARRSGARQYGGGPMHDGVRDTGGARMYTEMPSAPGAAEGSEQCCGGARTADGTAASEVTPKTNTGCSLPASAIFMLSPDDILPNPAQPRKMFTEEAILRLADSIRMHGMIQPLAVRRVTSRGKYELVAGERRLRAAKYLGLEKVPCFTVDADSEESAHLAIIENIQRENLNMFEQAQAIAGLMKLHCLTQEK